MTSRLEAFHSDRIALEVLQVLTGETDSLLREVLLRRMRDGRAVEYGAIEIQLGAFPDPVRTEILEGRRPLGGLLNRHPVLCGLLHVRGNGFLYGRGNVLRRGDGALLARIVEVLPQEVMVPAVEEALA
jgi:hypothetical protein